MKREERERLAKLHAAGTHGRWLDDDGDITVDRPAPDYYQNVVALDRDSRGYDGCCCSLELREDDRRLIVAAVNALPSLLSDSERLEEAIKMLCRLEWCDGGFCSVCGNAAGYPGGHAPDCRLAKILEER
jgi:hypothetical protein